MSVILEFDKLNIINNEAICLFVFFVMFCYVLFFLFVGCKNDTMRIVCVGDSITYGATIYDRENKSYPAVLGRLLGGECDVQNFRHNGATLLYKGDLPYVECEEFEQALVFRPDVVENNMIALIDLFQRLSSKLEVILYLPAKAYDENYDVVDTTIVARIEKVVVEKNFTLIDLYSALSGMPEYFPDKVHPNAAGVEVIAKEVRGKILL